MGTGSVAEKSDISHTLTLLSAREYFIEFCRREYFHSYVLPLFSFPCIILSSLYPIFFPVRGGAVG